MTSGGGMMGWGLGGVGMGIDWLFALVFWGLLIVAAALGVRWLWDRVGTAPKSGAADPALEILRRRYARGEIQREEFEAKKRDLAG